MSEIDNTLEQEQQQQLTTTNVEEEINLDNNKVETVIPEDKDGNEEIVKEEEKEIPFTETEVVEPVVEEENTKDSVMVALAPVVDEIVEQGDEASDAVVNDELNEELNEELNDKLNEELNKELNEELNDEKDNNELNDEKEKVNDEIVNDESNVEKENEPINKEKEKVVNDETNVEKVNDEIEQINEPSISPPELEEIPPSLQESSLAFDEPILKEEEEGQAPPPSLPPLDDSIPLVEEAKKDLLIQSNSTPSQLVDLEKEEEGEIDFTTLSREELIGKILFYKEQCQVIKQETDKKLKNSNDYIERLEEATEQRLDRLRKQNQEDIDEIKRFSDQLIKNEKEKAETYVKNMKKSVDEEREVLRQIENDSRSRFQKEKEEKNEALVEINRLKSLINSLHNDVEDREVKIQNLEENNLSIFVQKDKELEQAINQIENERKQSRALAEENHLLKEKVNELNDELKQFKNESEIRNSQINLLNEDNTQMHKKVTSLTRKNEELSNLYEFKLDEAASLKNEIERLNKQIDHLKRKRLNRFNGISPLTPNTASTPMSATYNDPNVSRCFSEYSVLSTTDTKSVGSSQKILEGLDRKASTAYSNDQLSDVSLGYDQSTVLKEAGEEVKEEGSVVNQDGIVTMNNLTPGATVVEAVEGPTPTEGIDLTATATDDTGKPEQRTLVIDTQMTINNNGGDPAFNYQDGLAPVLGEIEEEEEEEEEEDTIMGAMVRPLVFHTNDQTFINFNENLKENYDRIYNTKLVKQCELEEIVQCLDLSGSYMGFFSKRKLLNGLKNNTVVIQKANTKGFKDLMAQDIEPECALCSLKYRLHDSSMLWYQFFFEDEKNSTHELICMFCRERLVTICNWYKYLGMIANRIIKHDIETIYINCLQLKENMYHARNGLTTDDNDQAVLNSTVSANPRPDIIPQAQANIPAGPLGPNGDFIDVDIEGELLKKKSSFDSHSADSVTIKNNSEIMESPPLLPPETSTPTTTTPSGSKKRPSLCYHNTIQRKLSLTSVN